MVSREFHGGGGSSHLWKIEESVRFEIFRISVDKRAWNVREIIIFESDFDRVKEYSAWNKDRVNINVIRVTILRYKDDILRENGELFNSFSFALEPLYRI